MCLSASSSGEDNLASHAQLGLHEAPLAAPPLDRNAAGASHRLRPDNRDPVQPFPPGEEVAPINAKTLEGGTTHLGPNASGDLSLQDHALAKPQPNGLLLGAEEECVWANWRCRSRRGRPPAAEQSWRFDRGCSWIPKSGLVAMSEWGLRRRQDGVHDAPTWGCHTKRGHLFLSGPTAGRVARRDQKPL